MHRLAAAMNPQPRNAALAILAACWLPAIAWSPAARAQDLTVPGKGHGAFSMDYQQVVVEQRTDDRGRAENLGKVQYRTAHLNLDYGLSDRWALQLGLPYGNNRYTGAGSGHDPGIFADPHGQHFIDDGHFRGGWKDWNVGVRYQWLAAPLLVTPYLKFSFPSHDYQYYGESALGLHQTELQIGANAGGRLPQRWQNVYIVGGAAYSWMQRKGERRVNHSTISLDVGYFFTPRFSAYAGLTHRESYNGLDFPAALFDADGSLIPDRLFHHDTLRGITFTEARLGVSYRLGHRYTLFAACGRTSHGVNANLIKSSASIGISRGF